jgi:hypothetical protein
MQKRSMGILPMVLVLKHFDAVEKAIASARKCFQSFSLKRLLNRRSTVDIRRVQRITGKMPVLHFFS